MKKDSKVKKPKKEAMIYPGPTKSFRFRNPEGHMDKWDWITLTKGMKVPPSIVPIIMKEGEIKKNEDIIKEIQADLADDGKQNNSNNENKKSPGRKKKVKK